MSSSLPQRSYFKDSFQLPGTSWRLSGHSRALERTGFHLTGGGASIVLDAGVDLPDMSHPDMILVTHTHIDHCNALPMLARLTVEGSPIHVFAPGPVLQRLREFVALSFSMKVTAGDDMPERYTCPPVDLHNYDGQPVYYPWEESFLWWYPVLHSQNIAVQLGKGGKKVFVIETVQLMHTVATVGYVVYERRTKIKPELIEQFGHDKKLLGKEIQAARKREEQVDREVDVAVCAFICDTTAEAVVSGLQADHILSSPVVMIECTYLQEELTLEANKRGHVVWAGPEGLCPVVRRKLLQMELGECERQTFVLIHFSLRHSDSEISSFFLDLEAVGLGSSVSTEGEGAPLVVLWLDTGIVQLWYTS